MKQLSKKKKAILIGVGVFLLFCIFIGATSEKPEHIKQLFAAANAVQDDASQEEASEDNQETVAIEAATEIKQLEVIEAEKEDNGYITHIVGSLKNNTDRKYSYVRITFNLYDKSGAQVGTATDSIKELESGGVWKFKTVILGKEFDTYKVSDITAY